MVSQYLSLLLLPLAVMAAPVLEGGLTGNNKAAGGCAPMMVIFARGTTEPAPIGTVAGPPLMQALSAAVGPGNVAMQGVPYPADIPGFLAGGDPNGSKMMYVSSNIILPNVRSLTFYHRASMVKSAVTNCPNSKVVMVGYSQGGQLVHNAAKMLPADTMANVNSAIIFGDPGKQTPYRSIHCIY